jgi:hypothetical protein
MQWRLIMPTITEVWPVHGSLRMSMSREATVFGDDTTLHLSTLGDIPEGADDWGAIPLHTPHIWYGGHQNTTDDPLIRDLWLAHAYLGITVEEIP